jgi:hypothetical protein
MYNYKNKPKKAKGKRCWAQVGEDWCMKKIIKGSNYCKKYSLEFEGLKSKAKKEKEYHFVVKIVSDCLIHAENKKKAMEILKDNWSTENNIDLVDNEIKLIK